MSKVATYLRGHLTGEVDSRTDIRRANAKDAGVLALTPEMVVSPRNTNDIRKVARFAWQLAEKGHVLPLTARGSGRGTSGGAISKGAIISLSAHMNSVFEYDEKQKLVRLQPGASIEAVQSALALRGTGIMALDGLDSRGTIGGAIADNAAGYMSAKYGSLDENVSQLEVVLANGDVLQTGKISKKEFNRKKGLQGLEGDIYRGVDAVLEEFADEIKTIHEQDNTGYNAIARVKQKDGGVDLTPLFLGSQGTLGIISEMILSAEFRSQHQDLAALVFASANAARDALDKIRSLNPAFLQYFDAALFDRAVQAGHALPWFQALGDGLAPQVVVLVGFDDFNARTRAKNCKKLRKWYDEAAGTALTIGDDQATQDSLQAALEIVHYTALPDKADLCAPAIYADCFVPAERFEDFTKALAALGEKLRIELPIQADGLRNAVSIYPQFALSKVGDRQKILRLCDEIAKLVNEHGGAIIGQQAEGRILSKFAYGQLDERRVALYSAIRKVFDPLGTLNPGVKQESDLRTLAAMLDGSSR